MEIYDQRTKKHQYVVTRTDGLFYQIIKYVCLFVHSYISKNIMSESMLYGDKTLGHSLQDTLDEMISTKLSILLI